MRLLIFGSEGFIGSAFVKHHLDAGREIFGADILPESRQLAKGRYAMLSSGLGELEGILKCQQFDICLNCAGAANVSASLTDPWNDFNLNTSLVARLLVLLYQQSPNCKFINLSSAAVYGNPISFPVNTSATIQPISPYGIHKAAAELLLKDYSRVLGLKTVSLRIFSSYGPGQKKLLLWDLYQKLMANQEGKEIVLFGTGNESRDYVYIDDIIQQTELIIKHAVFNGEAYNIANGSEVFVKDIVRMMQECLATNIPVRFSGEGRPGDPKNWKADINQLLEWGYKQSMSMEDGIKHYTKWAEENA